MSVHTPKPTEANVTPLRDKDAVILKVAGEPVAALRRIAVRASASRMTFDADKVTMAKDAAHEMPRIAFRKHPDMTRPEVVLTYQNGLERSIAMKNDDINFVAGFARPIIVQGAEEPGRADASEGEELTDALTIPPFLAKTGDQQRVWDQSRKVEKEPLTVDPFFLFFWAGITLALFVLVALITTQPAAAATTQWGLVTGQAIQINNDGGPANRLILALESDPAFCEDRAEAIDQTIKQIERAEAEDAGFVNYFPRSWAKCVIVAVETPDTGGSGPVSDAGICEITLTATTTYQDIRDACPILQ